MNLRTAAEIACSEMSFTLHDICDPRRRTNDEEWIKRRGKSLAEAADNLERALKESQNMKKRKHRVVVEITFDEPVTAKQAQFLVRDIVESGSSEARMTFGLPRPTQVTKFDTKEFNRVLEAERRKEKT